ncbi:hypothetical protein [Pseudomonas putida]|uniref:Uncharacterized protein n=1 Tax=Pseudomonas putida TaxID=303 RepID=A0A2S3WC17_PSEPU|nr:hypothetical protein [Pseudomonas putida]POF88198.1 hypothetical protein BGP80_09535 [Pseudomonas putida]
MTPNLNPAQTPQQRAGALIVPTGWPCCDLFREFPQINRWRFYEWAKHQRVLLERQGWVHEEPYDAFVRRITQELDL